MRGSFVNEMSELEREFELEMDDRFGAHEHSSEADAEFEALLEAEVDDDYESSDTGDYAERFFELSLREFEFESEVDEALNAVLGEMEQEYFWGSLKKGLQKASKGLKKLPLKQLVNRGVQLAKSHVPALQAVNGLSQLARGNLKGMVGSLAKAGLGAAVPGAAPFLPAALKTLGFEAAEDAEANRQGWNNFVDVAHEAYEYLAENLHENIDDPLEANALASRAFETGIERVQSRMGVRPGGRRQRRNGSRPATRVIELAPGEEILLRAHGV